MVFKNQKNCLMNDHIYQSLPTSAFTKAFAARFLSSTPNVAITIHSSESASAAAAGPQAATIIVQLSKPVTIDNGKYLGLQYTFEQSGSQSLDGGSLEAFAKVVGDGINNDCSIIFHTGLLL